MDRTRPILVTGAGGSVGAVGRRTVELLLRRGFHVRAQVRTDDARAAALRDLGAEVSVGDLLDLHAVHRAVEGCERHYFGMSVAPRYLEAAVNMAAVARHHGVKAFVNISQMTVDEMDVHRTTSSPQQKQHWLVEQVLSWSGLPVVEVRPTAFMEGLFLQSARGIAAQGKLFASFGTGKNSAVAAVDVARAAAEILADPKPHIGKTYRLTGPVSQDMEAIAQAFTAALGRPIHYADIPLNVWTDMLSKPGLAPHVISHLTTMAQLHTDNRYDRFTGDVERLTGTRPMDVQAFVEQHAQAFAASTPP